MHSKAHSTSPLKAKRGNPSPLKSAKRNTAFNFGECPSPTKKSFKKVKIIKPIKKDFLSVYIVTAENSDKKMVMKTYPYEDGSMNKHFKHEIRCAFLDHEHIIKVLDIVEKKQAVFD